MDNSLKLKINQSVQSNDTLVVELDKIRFERLAASFGFFNPDFLESLDRAEDDYKKGRVRSIKSLKDL